MAIHTRELYHSANGDRWHLALEPASGRVFIKHEANLASGGHTAEIDIAAFLKPGAQGPEHGELLRLIGTLVEGPADTESPKTKGALARDRPPQWRRRSHVGRD